MRGCDQELCAHWTGHGCACGLLDVDAEPDVDQSDHPRTLLDMFLIMPEPTPLERVFDTIADTLASTWPFTWLNRALGGPVSGPK